MNMENATLWQRCQFNSIQHNDYIVILRATKAFKSPLLRSRNDRCRTIRDVKKFPERDLEGAEQERASVGA